MGQVISIASFSSFSSLATLGAPSMRLRAPDPLDSDANSCLHGREGDSLLVPMIADAPDLYAHLGTHVLQAALVSPRVSPPVCHAFPPRLSQRLPQVPQTVLVVVCAYPVHNGVPPAGGVQP